MPPSLNVNSSASNYLWASSMPRIDLILSGKPGDVFSWNQREGWARALIELGLLNEIYWIWDNQAVIDNLFYSLKKSSADLILILCGDHHQFYLHNNIKKQDYWRELKIPTVCHCCEKIYGSAFIDSEQKTSIALQTFDAFLYTDELSASLFERSGKASLWIPQYVDETVFVNTVPFENRSEHIFFRGQLDNFGIAGAYRQRRNLIEKIRDHPVFNVSEAYKPLLTVAQAAKIKSEHCFALNAPANCAGYSASLYEALACGCVTFQYELAVEEKLSRDLFKPGYHFLIYNAEDIDQFISQAECVVKNWRDYKQVAEQGRQECLEKHTIKKRIGEILSFLQTNWSKISKQNHQPEVFANIAAQNNTCVSETPLQSREDKDLLTTSQLSKIIPPEIKDDEFYNTIQKLAQQEDIKTILEIGSSSGTGSTKALVKGMQSNPNKPKLFCIEVSKPRFAELHNRYSHYPDVKCYNVSSVPIEKFPTSQQVIDFHSNIKTAFSSYPIKQVLGWLKQDIEYVQLSGVCDSGIQKIKQDNNIENFDMVLLDGSAFTGDAELDEVYGARFILLDDINDIKNYRNFKRLFTDPDYILVEENRELRNGYAVFERNKMALDIHFFTIVLNGEPFIRHHIELFRQLPFKWHWHIIEGVADLKHDTAWSLKFGGRITEQLHRNGLSNDGTTEYLNEIKEQFSDNITIYRKADGRFWDGKLEMINAPLENINKDCLLWQIDADELWTVDQIRKVHSMFAEHPDKTAAYYFCHYYVTENLVTTTLDTYGNNTSYEWLRTWRFEPGFRWASHEPPRLCKQGENKQWVDVASINPFRHGETEAKKLIFEHYAYVTEKQLRFRELYYGYTNALEQWKSLQQETRFPVLLRDYLPWVKDEAQVNTVKSQDIDPIAKKNSFGQWSFRRFDLSGGDIQNILWIRTDAIGDAVLSASMLPYIREKYKNAKITVICQEYAAELYQPCPFVDDIITFDKERILEDKLYEAEIYHRLQALKFDLSLHSVYSNDEVGNLFAINCYANQRIAQDGNLDNMTADQKCKLDRFYTELLPSEGEYKLEIERYKDFLKGLGISVNKLQPVIWLTPADHEFAENFFQENNLNPNTTIALFAGALHDCRLYGNYGAALSDFCKNNNLNVIALGVKKDNDINQRNLDATGVTTFNLSGKTTIRQSAAILKRCRLAVGAETALAHIACAVGTANVILLGGGHFGRFMPYSPLTSIACLSLDCYGCNWEDCAYKEHYCVKNLAPQVITKAIYQTFQRAFEKPRVFVQPQSLWQPEPGQPLWKKCDTLLDPDGVEIIPVDKTSYPAAMDSKIFAESQQKVPTVIV